ncbi:MAG: glycosyltransferase family 2 protein [Planctomycetota bacterium]|nr:glycosyltransferase family 2 protein [Planctomycetota bacterium]
MDVSVILVNYNTADLLPRAIGALFDASAGLNVQTIIVDNASRDGSVESIRRNFPDCSLIVNTTNVGFGRANNQALSLATGRYVLLLNTDAFVSKDSLLKTICYMDLHPGCGILGARLTGEDGAMQPSARHFPTPWRRFVTRAGLGKPFENARFAENLDGDPDSIRHCDWVPGCYFLVRRKVIDQVGLFDPRYFLYYEEVDLCLAAKKAGWVVVCFFGTTVIHIGGESAKSDSAITASGRQIETLQIESELLFFRKNSGLVGVLLNVVLTFFADAIIVTKRVLKWNTPLGIAMLFSHSTLVWSLFRRTRFGTQPTR